MGKWSVRRMAAVLCAGLATLSVATRSEAQTKPPIVVSQVNWITAISGGGFLAGAQPTGGSFAVNLNGDIIVSNTYGSSVYMYNGKTGAATTLSSSFSNPGGVTVDSKNNLYISRLYNNNILKVPYVNGAYVAVTDTTPAACTGNDTALCTFANPGSGINSRAMFFDASGNFYTVSTPSGTGSTAIYECSVSCQPAGKSTLIYTDTNVIGSIAVDPWGDLFFTDASFASTGDIGNLKSTNSALYELPYTSGSGFGSTPTTLATFTVSSPANFDDSLGIVTTDSNGTVYWGNQFNGMYAFPNNHGVINTANLYGVSTQGGKGMTRDNNGNLYIIGFHTSGDWLAQILINNIALPATMIAGTPATATANVMVNDGSCSAGPALSATAVENGTTLSSSAGEFRVAPGSSCGGQNLNSGGSSFSATFTFAPAAVGERTSTVTFTDTKTSGAGTMTVSGIGQGAVLAVDPGISSATTSGFTTPGAVAADASGNLFVADAGSGIVYKVASGTTTATSFATGFNAPSGLAFDGAGNLYVSESGNKQIVEIPNVAGTLTVSSKTTLVPNTTFFSGTVLGNPTGIAAGSDGTLYIADSINNRVVTSNTRGATGLRAINLNAPQGIAVDGSGNLYVANTGAGNVMVYKGGALSTITVPGIPTPTAVAVEASGSLLISDRTTGKIVRVPNESGTLTVADAVTVEMNAKSAYGVALDPAGNLYTSDGSAASVAAILRNAASLNFGSVSPGSSGNPQTISVENAGNTTLTGASPIFTAVSSSQFTLAAASTNGCTSGQSLSAGLACFLTANFTPGAALTPGLYSATSAVQTTNAFNTNSAAISLVGSIGGTTPQTITFTKPASPVAFGVSPITLVATGGASGNPVVFSVISGPGAVSGTTLTVTGAGTIVIAANQAGNATYAAATQVTQSVVVTPASQTITFTAPASPVTFGVSPITLSATGGASGNPVVFSVQSGPGSISGNTLTVTGAGTIVIAADQAASANYTAAPSVTQSVVVNQASQAITFAPASPVTYSKTAITLTATGGGSGNAVTFSIVSGPGTISGSSLTLTGAGTIVIAANQAGNTNYTAAPQVTASIVVNPAGVAATPTFSPAAGTYTTSQSVTLAATTPGSVIYYTTDGTTPTTSSKVYSGAITVAPAAGTYSLNETVNAIAVAPGYTTSATGTAAYVISLPVPGFTLTLNPASLTVPRGQTATVSVVVSPVNGFASPVALACSGLPAGATCTFTPSSVTPVPGPSAAALTITSTQTASAVHRNPLLPEISFALALCCLGFRRRRSGRLVLTLALALLGVGMVSGCASGTSTTTTTGSVTVTGTSGSTTQTATLAITIQ